MRIGIDFDNTISNYDSCFKFLALHLNLIKNHETLNSKEEIKNQIIKKRNGDKAWMKIQGLAYGKYINKAKIMQNFLKFLLISRSRKDEVFIVSHKTEFGHFDKEKISLRSSALKWMKNNKILDNKLGVKKNNIYFAKDRDEKIKIINSLECDYFIDDLAIVLNHTNFSKKTKKIYFSSQKNKNFISISNWDEIVNFFYKPIHSDDVVSLTEFFHKGSFKKITPINNYTNSGSYKIKLSNNTNYFIKFYSTNKYDKRERLKNEFKSLKLVNKHSLINTTKPIIKHPELNIGIFELIEGKKIVYPKNQDVIEFINFIKNLKILTARYKNSKRYELASEVSTNFENLVIEIDNRKKLLKKIIKNKKYYKLINKLDKIWLNMKKINPKFAKKIIQKVFYFKSI